MPDTGSDNAIAALLTVMLQKDIVSSLDQVNAVIDRLTQTSSPRNFENRPVPAPTPRATEAAAAPASSAALAPAAPPAEPAAPAAAPAAAPVAQEAPAAPKASPATSGRAQAPKSASKAAPVAAKEPEAPVSRQSQGKRPAPGSSAAHRDPSRLRIEDGRVVTAREMGQAPFVNPRNSIKGEVIICLEDGRELKMLKRHLKAAYGMTPEQYRAKWELPSDYPMVSPDYSMQKSSYALSVGLGTAAMHEKARENEDA